VAMTRQYAVHHRLGKQFGFQFALKISSKFSLFTTTEQVR